MATPARPSRLPVSLRWALAVASVAVAAALTTGPGGERLFPQAPERFVHGVTLLYSAAVLSAWLGGMGPGLLAALLAVVVVDWFITPPLYSISLDFAFGLRIAVFALSALLVGWLSERRRRTEDALRLSRDELEARVQARTADLSRSNTRLEAEIGARVRVEETLREQAALLDLTHDTVFVRDERDVIVYWNRGAEELYGWTKEEAVGTVAHSRMQTLFPVPLPDIMAELSRAGRSLHQAQAEVARVTRVTTLGERAASIAHEINQPLAAIVADANACLNWLGADHPPMAQVREAPGALVSDGDRAADVLIRIRSLLARSVVAREPCRLDRIIADVLPLVRPELGRQGIALQMSLAVDLPPVLGDRIQLQQVLINVLVNAAEAMREVPVERRRLDVRAACELVDDRPCAVVAVEDRGVGLGGLEPDRLFDAFYTTKPGGLGMGLSISRSIVEGRGR